MVSKKKEVGVSPVKKAFFSITPALNTVGGAEIYIRKFIAFLCERDDVEKVTVVHPKLPILKDFFGRPDSEKLEIVDYGFGKLTVDRDPFNPRLYGLLKDEGRRLRKKLIDEGYDLIFAHSSTDVFILREFLEKTSIIFYSNIPPYARTFPSRIFLKKYLGAMKNIICVSDFINEGVKKILGDKGRIYTVHNGVEFGFQRSDPPSEINKIGIVARFEKEKNVMLGIRVFENLGKKYGRLSLHLFGDGSQRKSLERTVAKRKIKRVSFHGFVKNTDEIYPYFDLLLVPSSMEALSLVALEAMSWKLPIVASKVGGIPEIVKDGRNGFLAKPDVESFSQKVTLLLENPSLIESFSRNYPETLQRFQLKEKFEELFKILFS